jgi:hypothetical protein
VDSEHENNKLNHFLQLGKASLVSDGPGSLLAGGRGGRGAILRRKSSLNGTPSPNNGKPLSSPKADLPVTPMKPKEEEVQHHPTPLYRAFSNEGYSSASSPVQQENQSVTSTSAPFVPAASNVPISIPPPVEKKEIPIPSLSSSSLSSAEKTSSTHQLFGSVDNTVVSESESKAVEIQPETEWKEPIVESKLRLNEAHVASRHQNDHGLTPLKSIPRIDSAGLFPPSRYDSKSHDSVEGEDGEKMQFFSLRSLKSSVSAVLLSFVPSFLCSFLPLFLPSFVPSFLPLL